MRHQCACGNSLAAKKKTHITCGQCNRQYTITEARIIPLAPGLGDYIATLTHYTGIAWLTKRLTRGQCGCPARQKWLNSLWRR